MTLPTEQLGTQDHLKAGPTRLIQIDKVSKTFNLGRPNAFTALHDIDLTLPEQQVTVLKGPSGSGKTTLLSLIGCMTRPTSGRIRLGDRDITSLPERFLSQIRRQTFGFIFQNLNLISGMNVLENIMMPAYPTGRRYGIIQEEARNLLAKLGLTSKKDQMVGHLSGGEQQRVAIARSLINTPEIIIADEPTAHLDTDLAGNFLEFVALFRDEGKTIVMSSHDPLIYEADIVDRVVEMRDGKIIGLKEQA